MTEPDFYSTVFSQDHPRGDGWGEVQWKGTQVCMDLHCKCGFSGHADEECFSYWRCPRCKQAYATEQNVKFIALTEQQANNWALQGYRWPEIVCDEADKTKADS